MTDTADDKIPLPRFSGRDDDYVEWKMQFAAYMRQKGVNINERGQDGTLRDGRSALDATKKAKLADRLTMALGNLGRTPLFTAATSTTVERCYKPLKRGTSKTVR